MPDLRLPTVSTGGDETSASLKRVGALTVEFRRKIHYFAAGTTVALGINLVSQLGQTCALSGQCASCGACVPRLLPILGLPLAADAFLTLVTKLRSRLADH